MHRATASATRTRTTTTMVRTGVNCNYFWCNKTAHILTHIHIACSRICFCREQCVVGRRRCRRRECERAPNICKTFWANVFREHNTLTHTHTRINCIARAHARRMVVVVAQHTHIWRINDYGLIAHASQSLTWEVCCCTICDQIDLSQHVICWRCVGKLCSWRFINALNLVHKIMHYNCLIWMNFN